MPIDPFSQSLVGLQERGGGSPLSDVAFNRMSDRATPLRSLRSSLCHEN
jgi:hypothetical protein